MLDVILYQQECKSVTKVTKHMSIIKLTICNDSNKEVWPALGLGAQQKLQPPRKGFGKIHYN